MKGFFCHFCKAYIFNGTEYLAQYPQIPGICMDGDFCDSPKWICCCSLDSCQAKLKETFDIIKEREFDMNPTTFKEQLVQIDNRRFEPLVKALGGVCEECKNCSYLNPKAKDGYRCAVLGSCPGVTLSNDTKLYMLHKLGVITTEEKTLFALEIE